MPGQPQIPPFRGQVPTIGRHQQQMQAQVSAAIQQLSQAMYVQLATAHVATRDEHQEVGLDRMRQLAKDSVAAARCYFEGIGAIEIKPEEETPRE